MLFNLVENYRISGIENMMNKISVIKSGSIKSCSKEKDSKKSNSNPISLNSNSTQGISTLVSIEDLFTLIYIPINNGPVIQKKLTLNPKLIELSKKFIFSKLLYDENKKR